MARLLPRGRNVVVLITGGAGYIGTLLRPVLEKRGHRVVALDRRFATKVAGGGAGIRPRSLEAMAADVRDLTVADLGRFDAVIHLAELSREPSTPYDVAYRVNYEGTMALAQKCKHAGVKRFLYSSCCSVYGDGGDDLKSESSPLNPQNACAECKVLVERGLFQLAGRTFSPTSLRSAEAFGVSPRMRGDLLLHRWVCQAVRASVIEVPDEGSAWRPLVHVRDICHAFACALDAPRELVHNHAFNVGRDDHNVRVSELAQFVSHQVSRCRVVAGAPGGDTRSYRVSFDKIRRQLPGFAARHTIGDGVRELSAHYAAARKLAEKLTERAS